LKPTGSGRLTGRFQTPADKIFDTCTYAAVAGRYRVGCCGLTRYAALHRRRLWLSLAR
jgi:hypothetical protein